MIALESGMIDRIKRLFTIKTKFEAFAIIYALSLGAVDYVTKTIKHALLLEWVHAKIEMK